MTDSPRKPADRIVMLDEFFVTLRGPANLSRKQVNALSKRVKTALRRVVAELRAGGLDIETD